jgi:DNA-binding transcriptional regulator LsrR (DeoR family)
MEALLQQRFARVLWQLEQIEACGRKRQAVTAAGDDSKREALLAVLAQEMLEAL